MNILLVSNNDMCRSRMAQKILSSFWTWYKDIYIWSSAGKSDTIFSGRGDGTEWIRLFS